ncbi:MAG: hypothetical protein ACRD4O_18515 [Bryobacteraceae bacterium]
MEDGLMSPEDLSLREQITEAVIAASLEVDGVVAEIEDEQAQVQEVRVFLKARADHKVAIGNIANIIAVAGVGVVGNSLQLRQSTAQLGNIISVASAATGLGLQIYSQKVQSGGKRRLGVAPDMLAQIFDRPHEKESYYPPEVWTYLNTVPPDQHIDVTWKEQMIKEWVRLGRIKLSETPKAEEKIKDLTSSIETGTKVNMDQLEDRSAMLSDVRGRVALMKRDLSQLMRGIRVEITPKGKD